MHDDDIDYELPPDDVPRFAYEEAEARLDRFAARQDEAFQRAWMMTKYMATAYAYGDYWDGEIHPALAMSRGWEELQMAFTGRGEAFLSGAVLELYCRLPDKQSEKRLRREVRKAWKLAEKATPRDAERLYTKRDRLAKLRHPDDGFTLAPVAPNQGPRLREWALSEGLDADHVQEHLHWLEAVDRGLEPDPEPEGSSGPGASTGLRVIPGGRASD